MKVWYEGESNSWKVFKKILFSIIGCTTGSDKIFISFIVLVEDNLF